MIYRKEIDGLRALAIIPVLLFHAGFETFSGGYVGVDVFFVISGFLITTIILSDLENGSFSIGKFYEKRARRILPALFTVMLTSTIAGYFLLMPDEYKNFGQSLVATTLFSNNILLALTSGYWELASEFKPLLHTWSLGVEEQYYIITPVLLIAAWRHFRSAITPIIIGIFVFSGLAMYWQAESASKWSFYGIHSRAWELAVGSLAAILLSRISFNANNENKYNIASAIGLALILVSVFTFTKHTPSYALLLPTVGAALIIMFSKENSFTTRILSNRAVVFIGLISYSLYLWHQPIFSFIRIYSQERPNQYILGISLIATLPIAYISWKFIETPFRSKNSIKTSHVVLLLTSVGVLFIATGLFLNKSYGLPNRIFNETVKIEEMDKRIYNEIPFHLKLDQFESKDRPRILIMGNSFARDFTNITLETFGKNKAEIVYRDDIDECLQSNQSPQNIKLIESAEVLVFASGDAKKECIQNDLTFAQSKGKKIYYIGTKHFGHNLNWLIRVSEPERKNSLNTLPEATIQLEKYLRNEIPPQNFIALLNDTNLERKTIPITDTSGNLLSTDRAHLTKYGAIFFGQQHSIQSSAYARLFR